MSGWIGTFMGQAQQAAEMAKQAKESRARKTEDGRRIFRIACLGHAHSGKTAFWTVLHESTRSKIDFFNVQSGDNTTAAYLIRQREAMQAGAFWIPAPGEKPGDYEPGYPPETGDVTELLFLARDGGQAEFPILVQDYPGKAIGVQDSDGRSSEVVEFLKAADGVLFFVDAVATRVSPQILVEQLLAFNSQMKMLEDRKGHISRPVGLVITKSDQFDEYRPANPVELISASDQRRRGDVYSKFLATLLRSEAFAKDAAWKVRVEKTLTRMRNFADALLKKCRSTQVFFVSTVGDKRHRPIEPGDAQASMAGSSASSFVVGKHQSGLEAPVRWIVHELSVMQRVYQARRLRNRALTAAAVWSLAVTLPFLGYLGCAVGKIEKDFRTTPAPTLRILKDVHAYEENRVALIFERVLHWWSPGYLATAQRARSLTAGRAVAGVREDFLFVIRHNQAAGESADTAAASHCTRLANFLGDCLLQLQDTTSDYRETVLQAQCLRLVTQKAAENFKMPSAVDRLKGFGELSKLAGTGVCMSPDMVDACDSLARNIVPQATREQDRQAGKQVVQAPAPPSSIKDAYNTAVSNYGPGTKAEARLNAKLITDLHTMMSSPHARDAASVAAENQIRPFLAAVAQFENGVKIKIKLTQLSSPATVKVAQPGNSDYEEKQYGEGDEITLNGWKLGTEVRLLFLLKDYNSTPQVLDAPDGLVTQSKQRISIPLQPIHGGPPRQVDFQYEIAAPKLDDKALPPLNKIP